MAIERYKDEFKAEAVRLIRERKYSFPSPNPLPAHRPSGAGKVTLPRLYGEGVQCCACERKHHTTVLLLSACLLRGFPPNIPDIQGRRDGPNLAMGANRNGPKNFKRLSFDIRSNYFWHCI
jgi:hypothetical protein